MQGNSSYQKILHCVESLCREIDLFPIMIVSIGQDAILVLKDEDVGDLLQWQEIWTSSDDSETKEIL